MSAAALKGLAKVGGAAASAGAAAARGAKAAGKAAGAAASAAAGTAAKNAADQAKTLAKQSDSVTDAAKSASKSGDDIVGASATTTKATKQLDSAADVGKATKKADDVADVGKATKKADDVADVGKAGKKADDVADAAKTGKKGMDATTVAKYTAAGGLAYYVSEQIGAANKKVGDCIENCLPDNWASYEYEEIEKDQLNFKSLEELQAEDPEYDEPICSAKINDGEQGPCPTFCSKTCNDKYDKGILDTLGPAGDVIKETTGAAGDVMEQTLDDLGLNPFGPGGLLEGMKETATRAIFIILCICCLSILLKLLGIF